VGSGSTRWNCGIVGLEVAVSLSYERLQNRRDDDDDDNDDDGDDDDDEVAR